MSFDSTFTPPPLESEPPPVPWGVKEIAIAIGGWLIALVAVIALVVSPVDAIAGSDSVAARIAIIHATTLTWLIVGLVGWLWLRRRGLTFEVLGWRAPRGLTGAKLAAYVAGGVILGFVIVGGYQALVDALGLDFLLPEDQFEDKFFDSDLLIISLGVAVLLIAPVAEETFFRGFVFAGLFARYGWWPAAIVSGLIFSAAHLQPGLILPFALIGIMFAWFYRSTGSVFPSMVVHFVFNALSYISIVATKT